MILFASYGLAGGDFPGWKPRSVQQERRVLPGKFFQQLRAGPGSGGDPFYQGFDIGFLVLDEAKQADIFFVQQK